MTATDRENRGDLVIGVCLQRKLWLAIGIPLLLLASLTAGWQYLAYGRALGERVEVLAAMLAANVKGVNEPVDRRLASRWLDALRADPDIDTAALLQADHQMIAWYKRQGDAAVSAGTPDLLPEVPRYAPATGGRTMQQRRMKGFDFVAPLTADKRIVGYLYVHASAGRFYDLLLIDVLLLAIALVLAVGLARRGIAGLLRQIVEPLQRLGAVMRQVGAQHDFGIRVSPDDRPPFAEIGVLSSTFNAMLEQIQQRDKRLAEQGEELVESNRALQSAFRQATEARDIAEHANRAKSMFLAHVSHEIRTPMTGVIGMTEALCGTALGEEQRAFARTAMNSARSLLEVVNDILDFAKIEAGELELAPVDFNLRDLLEEAIELFAADAYDKGIDIGGLIAPGTPHWLNGDAGRLRQILANLLSNAVKFTAQGEVRVDLAIAERVGADIVLLVKVSDTGMGIDVGRQSTLFDRFGKARDGTPQRYPGSGLGLAIVRQLLTLMGGEIGVRSAAGDGSLFWFTVRMSQAKAQRLGDHERDGDILRHRRALVVNDAPLERAILAQHLQAWGMRSRIAVNGRAALEALRQAASTGNSFDLVLLSLAMPGVDSLALCREIRGDSHLSGLRIVMITAGRRSDQVRNALATGVDACLSRPIGKKHLYRVLRQAMGIQIVEENSAGPNDQAMLADLQARVLLVEDDLVSREVALATLSGIGCRTRVAGDGIEALAALAEEPFHVVLMDCQMPGMDGYALARRMRDIEADSMQRGGPPRRMPIIALTARAMQGDREACLMAGMDDYLAKPYTREALYDVLQRWVLQQDTALDTIPPMLPGDRPPVDRNVLWALRNRSDGALVRQVIGLFVKNTPEKLVALGRAVEEQDCPTVAALAHQIKSASAALGLTAVVDAASSLENDARAEKSAQFDALSTLLAAAFDAVLPYLEHVAKAAATERAGAVAANKAAAA